MLLCGRPYVNPSEVFRSMCSVVNRPSNREEHVDIDVVPCLFVDTHDHYAHGLLEVSAAW